MDDKILSLLNQLLEGQNRIENKLDAVVAQTVDLTEFRTEMKEFRAETHIQLEDIKNDLTNVEVITASKKEEEREIGKKLLLGLDGGKDDKGQNYKISSPTAAFKEFLEDIAVIGEALGSNIDSIIKNIKDKISKKK